MDENDEENFLDKHGILYKLGSVYKKGDIKGALFPDEQELLDEFKKVPDDLFKNSTVV